ncbi:MAG TPA: NIPSNAP family protein [Mycobacteriales bacterium]|nr:NIPSNAP family protein [Mycobacteriales bacterium]
MVDGGWQGQAGVGSAAGTAVASWPIVELRQYTLVPGGREVLVELFDRAFTESQEELGMQIIGQFRDLDRADRFVWLRGYLEMDSRPDRLTAFYTGPVWKEHSAAANATMLDIDDVLLLRPVTDGGGFPLASPLRPPLDAAVPAGSLITATVYPLPGVDPAGEEAQLLDLLHSQVDPVLAEAGRHAVAELRTEPAANNFPALPVREGEQVVVRFAAYDSEQAHAAYQQRLRDSPAWQEIKPRLQAQLAGPAQRLRLRPTPRSRTR